MSEPVSLRPVTDEDEGFLLRVYSSTREEEMAIVPWDPDQKAAFLEMQYRAQKLSYWAEYPDSTHSVIVENAEPVGRIWVDQSDTEIRLIDIALLPAARGRGIGAGLLEQLQVRASEVGVPLRHMVLKTNGQALRFYKRLGFTVVGEIPTHVTMEWTASS